MIDSTEFLSPSEAARRLGVSSKALRLYEQRGLIAPARTEAGWRAYGPTDMAAAERVTRLRALGLSLAEVAEALNGNDHTFASLLAAHQAKLGVQARQIAGKIEKVRALRVGKLAAPNKRQGSAHVAFDLPWPWGGERFELFDISPLNYITGPLGCGKTRLAAALVEHIPGASFLGIDRRDNADDQAVTQLDANPVLRRQVGEAMHTLAEHGATRSLNLSALMVALHKTVPAVLVVDMVEHGLDQSTQAALSTYLRHIATGVRPLFLTTRSSTILDMRALGPDETIIHCPANHSPPALVSPYPGASGFEAVASCLASPDVRARTAGVVARGPAPMM